MSKLEERNFRSHYYERVGFKSLDETKTLDTLLNEEPRSIDKLKQFCLRFSVPSSMRLELWKIICEFSSTYVKNSADKLWWKEVPYYHVKKMEKLIGKITEDMSLSDELTVQFLLRKGWVKFDVKSQLKESNSVNFNKIAGSMLRITNKAEVASFYLSEYLYDKINSMPPKILLDLQRYFDKKLNNTKIGEHFLKLGLTFKKSQFQTWCYRIFAGLLNENSLVRIWDKVIGGSVKILAFVGLSIMNVSEKKILDCQSAIQVNEVFYGIDEETSNVIVNEAINCWIKDGCQLFVHDSFKDECPYMEDSIKGPFHSISASKTKLVNEIKIPTQLDD